MKEEIRKEHSVKIASLKLQKQEEISGKKSLILNVK